MDPDKHLKYCSYGKHMTANNTMVPGISIGGQELLYLPGAGCASCNKELRQAIHELAFSFHTNPKIDSPRPPPPVIIAPPQPPKDDTVVAMTLTILKEPLLGGVTKKRRVKSGGARIKKSKRGTGKYM